MLILVGLIVILYLVFRTSTVQTWVTSKIANKLSAELKTEIKIQGVDISWFLNGVLEGVSVNDRHHNPLLTAKRIEFSLKKYSGKRNILLLSKVEIDDLFVALRTYKGEKNMQCNEGKHIVRLPIGMAE